MSIIKKVLFLSIVISIISISKTVAEDLKKGFIPLCVVTALGTTGSTAIDPLFEISKITKKYNIGWI